MRITITLDGDEILSVTKENLTKGLLSIANILADPPDPPRVTVPKDFLGWTVDMNGSKYFKVYKRIGGKLRTIYIGKEWDERLASLKIAMYEARD